MNGPDLYTKANGPQRRDVSNISDEFSDEIGQMSGRCLDIGSGPGDTVVDFILPKLNKEACLVCSDISEEMVSFGRNKNKDNGRLSFIKLNIESPDLPKDFVNQVDHITSFYCLHWCKDIRQAFQNIFDLLRPGGTTLLVFVANCPGMNSYKELEAMPRYQPYIKDADRYIPLFQHSLEPRKTLKALVKDVGFKVHHCSIREQSYTFVNFDALSKFVLAVNPFIDLIPADLTADYKRDLVNEYARQCIVFNKNDENEEEYSILMLYGTCVAYLEKPSPNNDYYSKE